MNIHRLTTPLGALRVAPGAAALLAGFDKFFNLLADCPGYLSPAAHLLPRSTSSLRRVVAESPRIIGHHKSVIA